MKTLIRLLVEEQTDLGLHYMSRHVCPKIYDHKGIIRCILDEKFDIFVNFSM